MRQASNASASDISAIQQRRAVGSRLPRRALQMWQLLAALQRAPLPGVRVGRVAKGRSMLQSSQSSCSIDSQWGFKICLDAAGCVHYQLDSAGAGKYTDPGPVDVVFADHSAGLDRQVISGCCRAPGGSLPFAPTVLCLILTHAREPGHQVKSSQGGCLPPP